LITEYELLNEELTPNRMEQLFEEGRGKIPEVVFSLESGVVREMKLSKNCKNLPFYCEPKSVEFVLPPEGGSEKDSQWAKIRPAMGITARDKRLVQQMTEAKRENLEKGMRMAEAWPAGEPDLRFRPYECRDSGNFVKSVGTITPYDSDGFLALLLHLGESLEKEGKLTDDLLAAASDMCKAVNNLPCAQAGSGQAFKEEVCQVFPEGSSVELYVFVHFALIECAGLTRSQLTMEGASKKDAPLKKALLRVFATMSGP
jgi:hypothetical protein